jgi:lipopolysaccharide transport system ATP-binding protein
VPYFTLRDALARAVTAPLRNLRSPSSSSRTSEASQIWALKDISFEVHRGDVLGIIGRNGAGKSTLLKILSRVTKPTVGHAQIRGRLGSLLDVGTGFHPELTGRENTYMNGAILGMSKKEIARRFDEIVAFAEIEQFIDTPVKYYSSGMYVRLAFSVAAHLEPEILVVDEVLAVGDVAFQEKCLGKMKHAASGGRTVLFVSHNLIALQALCQHALWLDKGGVIAEGRPSTVVSSYLEHVRTSRTEVLYKNFAEAPGNELVRLRKASIRPLSEGSSGTITVRTPLFLEFEFWITKPGMRLDFGFNLYNEYGILVLNTGTVDCGSYPAGLIGMSGQIPGDLLNTGVHRIELLVASGGNEVVFSCPDLLAFEVTDSLDLRGVYHGEWPGAVRPNIQWTTEVLEKWLTSLG